MTFKPNIPQATDKLSNSQRDLLGNFGVINTAFDMDHVSLVAPAVDAGKHNQVTFPRSAAGPGPAATEAAVYQKLAGGNSELFLQRDAVAAEIQLTTGSVVGANPGTTFLPGGLIMKFGTASFAALNFQLTITFATAFPNNIFLAVATSNLVGTPQPLNAHTLAAGSFIIEKTGVAGTPQASWIAIGN